VALGLALLAGGMLVPCAVAARPPAATAEELDASVLVLGRISDDPRAHYEQLRPLLDYVVAHMHDVGITRGRILMARDAQQMASYLRRGRVDWLTETSGTAMDLAGRCHARVLLLTERDGVRDYRSLIFVRKDSPVRDLQDLRGRTIALQNAQSTSSYLLPLMALLQSRLHPELLLSPRDTASPDSVGYVFARTGPSVAAYVHKGLADAGALNDVEFTRNDVVPEAFAHDLRVIHRSEAFPRAVELVRGDLDERVRRRLQEVLLQAAGDPAARPALRQFFHTSGFYRVDPQSERQLERLRAGFAQVRRSVE
jgi:phosphonate transport system substrate-binding protein